MAKTSGEEALTGSWAHPELTLEASTAHCHTGAEVTPTDAELELCSEVHVLKQWSLNLRPAVVGRQAVEPRLVREAHR